MTHASEQDTGRILIVDDLRNWREVLTAVLVEDGHQVHAVADPAQALEHIAQEPVDVAILDLRLQDKDIYDVRGVQLLQEIHAKSPRTRVVMLTGFPSDGLLEKVPYTYSVDGFWLKNPVEHRFDSEMFRQEIRSLVRKAQQHFIQPD